MMLSYFTKQFDKVLIDAILDTQEKDAYKSFLKGIKKYFDEDYYNAIAKQFNESKDFVLMPSTIEELNLYLKFFTSKELDKNSKI